MVFCHNTEPEKSVCYRLRLKPIALAVALSIRPTSVQTVPMRMGKTARFRQPTRKRIRCTLREMRVYHRTHYLFYPFPANIKTQNSPTLTDGIELR